MYTVSGTPDISRHLARDQEIIQKSLARACALLPDRVFEEYSAFLKKIQNHPELLTSSIRWFLHHYFLFAGFVQAIVSFNEQPVFTFGAKILPWNAADPREFPPELLGQAKHGIPAASALSRLERGEERGPRHLLVEGVVPAEIEPIAGSVLDIEIMPMARSYYFFDPGIQENRHLNFLKQVEDECNRQCRVAVSSASVFSISYFRFQDMSLYFEMSGEKAGIELMEAIQQVIHQNLKRTDTLFQLSPFSYLALSPGADRAQIFERYQNVYFGYKSLYMDYDLNVVTLNDLPEDWSTVWAELGV